MSGVSITCFAASYGVVLLLELSRLLFRSGIRGALMLGFAAAGLLAHTIYLAERAASASGYPLSSEQDWYVVAAWILAAFYLYLTAYHRDNAFGVFLLPLVLALVAAAVWLADPAPFERRPALFAWGVVHGTSLMLATVAILVGFAAGLMYLAQDYRLKRKLPPPRGLRLPSLEWLQKLNNRAVGLAMLLLGIGILAGIVLNMIYTQSGGSPLDWTDPVILATLLMFCWLVLSGGVSAFYRPSREGRRVAYLTVLSFVFLICLLAIGFFFDTEHRKLKVEHEAVPPAMHSGGMSR
ncbi:MAG: cytochrome c biogenesis protein CcsA [Planctomycetaceae bacterium]|nr:cytochrome c biogenesis protein CcsA [Planctomycetaceae bacterium]